MSIKIATFADLHIGVTGYGSLDSETGLNTRVINALASLDKMIDYCINNNIKYIIGAGDMYKNNLPSPTLQNELDKRLNRAAKNGINIYIMDGNHDISTMKFAKSALNTFKTLEIDNIHHSKDLKYYTINNELKLVMLPTYCNKQEVENILKELESETMPVILVGHLTLKGALLNDWLIEQNEDAIDIELFKNSNIIAAIFGHLHKYQILNKKPLIYYTGSLQRIDFTEEKQEKGFVILDINGRDVSYEFIEVPSQKFLTLDYNVRNLDNENDIILNDIKNKDVKDCIVRLRIKADKNNNINDNIILKELYSKGISKVASIQKDITKEDSVRNENIKEDINIQTALELYFEDKKEKEEIIKEGLKLIKKLQDGEIQ